MMQNIPEGWSQAKVQALNALLDVSTAYTQFDYARKIIAPNDKALKAIQDDIGSLVAQLGQRLINTP